MFYNYLITAWRNLLKNGLFSVINIFGLALGLMSCILILLFVKAESGYDKWLPDSDRLVRMHTAYSMPNQPPFETVRSAGMMMEAIRDYASGEIAAGVRFIQWRGTLLKDQDVFNEQITMVDGSFFELFKLPFVHGDAERAFTKPMDTLITEEMAIKYFGTTDAVGKMLTVVGIGPEPVSVSVTGVLADLPEQTHMDINILVHLNPALFGENNGVLDTWTSLNVYSYFKMNPGVTIEQLQTRMNYWLDNESPLKQMMAQFLGDAANGKNVTDFLRQRVMSVPDLHLHARKHAGNMGDLTPMGDAEMIDTFIVVAALVLLIACINFTNLSTAKGSKRAKEVAMRKVLGASRLQVAIQFLAEAITIVLVALLFALVAVELVLPLYNQILGRTLEFNLLSSPDLLVGLLAMALIVGILAGTYPALFLSRFRPGMILKASKSSETAGSSKLRTVLVVFQFSTSIALVIATLVVYGQTIYSNNADTGFNAESKMVLNIRGAGEQLQSLTQELRSIDGVSAVTLSSEAPSQDNENNQQYKLLETLNEGVANEPIIVNYHNMGFGFFEAYDVQPIEGRLFDEAFGGDELRAGEEGEIVRSAAILNYSALSRFGFSSAEQAVGKTLEMQNNGPVHLTIVGVIPDLHFRSIKFGIRPTVYTNDPNRFRVATINYDEAQLAYVREQVEAIWKRNVPMQPINLEFLSEMMAAQYQSEVTTARLFLAFSVLAIVVACLGLYGLSAFTVERKTKEIGIRKVMGANVRDIVKLLVWQFSKPVLIANLIAWPIAIYGTLGWLQSFPYRIDYIWLLPLCLSVGALSLLIAWFTVGGIASAVARRSPIQALRYE